MGGKTYSWQGKQARNVARQSKGKSGRLQIGTPPFLENRHADEKTEKSLTGPSREREKVAKVLGRELRKKWSISYENAEEETARSNAHGPWLHRRRQAQTLPSPPSSSASRGSSTRSNSLRTANVSNVAKTEWRTSKCTDDEASDGNRPVCGAARSVNSTAQVESAARDSRCPIRCTRSIA